MLVDERSISDRTKAIKEATVKLLCTISTVKTNRFYIPGETNLVERLRKESFDKGIFATLTCLYQILNKQAQSSADSSSYKEIKQFLREKVLNLLELNDLVYHASVVEAMMEKLKYHPQLAMPESQLQRSNSAEGLDSSSTNENSAH